MNAANTTDSWAAVNLYTYQVQYSLCNIHTHQVQFSICNIPVKYLYFFLLFFLHCYESCTIQILLYFVEQQQYNNSDSDTGQYLGYLSIVWHAFTSLNIDSFCVFSLTAQGVQFSRQQVNMAADSLLYVRKNKLNNIHTQATTLI